MARRSLISMLVVLVAACQQQTADQGLVIKDASDEDATPWWAQGDDDHNAPGDDGPAAPQLLIDSCDGIDNDLDGETDEGFMSTPCRLGDDAGVTVCVNGREACHQCEPGETRQADCGCGIARHDRCNDVGRWLTGACSGCEEERPVGCAAATACEPGTHRTQRCDNCTPGVNCGPSCIGTDMVCNNSCEWVPQGDCAPREAECDRDQVRFEQCGKCGVRKVTCDGCYYDVGPCIDEGVCEPGDTFSASCGGNSCGNGLSSTIRCNDKCEWIQGECNGCDLAAVPPIVHTACVPGADCGERVVQEGCLGAGSSQDCAGEQRTHGEIQLIVLQDDCVYLPCRPGDTREVGCTTALGQCGTQGEACSNSCEWPGGGGGGGGGGACTARPDSCIPGQQFTEQLSCGANTCGATYTRTSTCGASGCGYGTQNGGGCPACAVGDTSEQGCTTPEGRCGTQSRVCGAGCGWGGWSACVARPESCIPGEVQSSDTVSCGAGLCGASVTQQTICRADGCGFGTSQIGACPSCAAGESQSGACTTAGGSCGTQSRSCSGSCEWGGWSSCQPSPNACDVGSIQPRSCTWFCGLPGTQIATCNGCGWDVTGQCEPNNAGACAPGASEVIGPCASCPSQTQTRNCDATCSWVPSTCRACL